MGLINVASGNSVWRGLDYSKDKRVSHYKKVSETEYEGIVIGTDKNYNIWMDINHPRKSKCDCPHAKDKRIICKHIIALYFTVFPNEIDKFLKEVEESQKKYEDYEGEIYKKTLKRINSMSKSELQEVLIMTLNIAPEWVYERFVRDNVGW